LKIGKKGLGNEVLGVLGLGNRGLEESRIRRGGMKLRPGELKKEGVVGWWVDRLVGWSGGKVVELWDGTLLGCLGAKVEGWWGLILPPWICLFV
jgi:hypothetical protein